MPTEEIRGYQYTGDLLAVDLLSGTPTVLLSAFAAGIDGPLTDDQGTLSTADNGVSSFNNQTLTYVGSGTVQPGALVADVLVPLGSPVAVVVFEAGGNLYFHYPDGEPSVIGAVAMVVSIDSTEYEVFPNPYVGGPDSDTLAGDAFNNDMYGGGGADLLTGGAGNDTMGGGAGLDDLRGGSGNDRLLGGSDDDHLRGDIGNDTLLGEAGSDTLLGNDGADSIVGGIGNDIAYGGVGADRLFGGDGADAMQGDGGNDFLHGNAGNDTLRGNHGNDTLNGGYGKNEILGGMGQDVFVFGTAIGNNILLDWRNNIDQLDFRQVTTIQTVDEFLDHARQVGTSVIVRWEDGNRLEIQNAKLGQFDSQDFMF